MLKPNPIGHTGSWFATLDGEELPCVHLRHTGNFHLPPYETYDDPYGRPEGGKWTKFFRAINEGKKVILTQSGANFRRTGYLGLYSVDDIEADSSGLRFRFVEKLAEFANRPAGDGSGKSGSRLVETKPPHRKPLKDPIKLTFEPGMIDWIERYIASAALGAKGEELVLTTERERLRSAGRADLADKVVHVSAQLGDGAGYDILSYSLDGQERFIEVKTTAGAAKTPFYLSANELAIAKENVDIYELWRLYSINPDGTSAKFYRIRGDLNGLLQLDPICYRAQPI